MEFLKNVWKSLSSMMLVVLALVSFCLVIAGFFLFVQVWHDLGLSETIKDSTFSFKDLSILFYLGIESMLMFLFLILLKILTAQNRKWDTIMNVWGSCFLIGGVASTIIGQIVVWSKDDIDYHPLLIVSLFAWVGAFVSSAIATVID